MPPRSTNVDAISNDHIRPYLYTNGMGKLKKVTVNLPADVLANAQRLTGKGITSTLLEGLAALERRALRSALRQLRGQAGFELNLERTRR
jgi:hypothetical protein